MRADAPGQMISLHIILLERPGEKPLHESYSTDCTGKSSCITHVVQYSCSASGPKAVVQKKGGGEKKDRTDKEDEGVKRKVEPEDERGRNPGGLLSSGLAPY